MTKRNNSTLILQGNKQRIFCASTVSYALFMFALHNYPPNERNPWMVLKVVFFPFQEYITVLNGYAI
jgi:hypothetical protein